MPSVKRPPAIACAESACCAIACGWRGKVGITAVPSSMRLVSRAHSAVRGRIQPGATVAIGVGSRGITNLALVVRTLVGVLKEAGARPFIVPAMGSHGGATVEGQRAILAGYGITEDGVGAPIRPSMETVDLGATDGVPIHFDRTAFEADHVAIVNRVKPHTNFAGE